MSSLVADWQDEAVAVALDVVVVCDDATLTDRLVDTLAKHRVTITAIEPDAADLRLAEDVTTLVILAAASTPSKLVATVKELRAHPRDPRVVICRDAGGPEVRRTVSAGATGFVLAASLETSLVPTVHAVLAGQVVLPAQDRLQVATPTLSAREKQVLGMVVMGYMNCQIAEKLFLAESTVKSHLSSAFTKLGVRSRNEAVDLILDNDNGLGRGILAITPDQPNFVRTTSRS